VLLGKIPIGDDQCRFDYAVLEQEIKSLVESRLMSDKVTMSGVVTSTYPICPTFVVAKKALQVGGTPTIFRSYTGEGIRPSKCEIWKAARATSAAPSFFKEMYIDVPRPGVTYVDGGLGHNNPAELALDEAGRIWPDNKSFCLLSIGTGRQQAFAVVNTSLPNDVTVAQRSLFD